MSHYDMFEGDLTLMATLLCLPHWRQTFVEPCVRPKFPDSVQHFQTSCFPKPIEWCWGQTVKFVVDMCMVWDFDCEQRARTCEGVRGFGLRGYASTCGCVRDPSLVCEVVRVCARACESLCVRACVRGRARPCEAHIFAHVGDMCECAQHFLTFLDILGAWSQFGCYLKNFKRFLVNSYGSASFVKACQFC